MEDSKPTSSVALIASKLEITALVLALIGAVLYVHGMAFHRAYLAGFGLTAEAFPLSADQAMLRGFEALAVITTFGLERLFKFGWLLVPAFFVGIIAIAISIDWFISRLVNRAWFRRLRARVKSWFFETLDDDPGLPPRFLLVDWAIRTLGTGISQYNGLAIHRWVLNRLENALLYSSFQRVTNQSI